MTCTVQFRCLEEWEKRCSDSWNHRQWGKYKRVKGRKRKRERCAFLSTHCEKEGETEVNRDHHEGTNLTPPIWQRQRCYEVAQLRLITEYVHVVLQTWEEKKSNWGHIHTENHSNRSQSKHRNDAQTEIRLWTQTKAAKLRTGCFRTRRINCRRGPNGELNKCLTSFIIETAESDGGRMRRIHDTHLIDHSFDMVSDCAFCEILEHVHIGWFKLVIQALTQIP